MAARAKKTNARGEARPDAALAPVGALVELPVVEPPVVVRLPEVLVLEAEEDSVVDALELPVVEELAAVVVELPDIVGREEEDEAPPMSWNCVL